MLRGILWMNKNEIINILKNTKNDFDITQFVLFGSVSTNTNHKDSDIDIYVEFKHKTFDNLAGLWNHLEELYHKKIDLFHKHKNNNKVIISNIQKDVIYG